MGAYEYQADIVGSIACCLPDGVCVDLPGGEASGCVVQGGILLAAGTDCASGSCPDFVACCTPSGCVDMPWCECLGADYFPASPTGGTCASFTCDVSACCLPDETCVMVLPPDCVQQGGWPSEGQTCDDITCSPMEACCVHIDWLGGCFNAPSSVCEMAGGDPQGAGSECSSVDCPDTAMEACCFPGGCCIDVAPDGCIVAGGNPQGPGTACSTAACP